MKFQDKLSKICASKEAIKWVGRRGVAAAWNDCQYAEWMLCFAGGIDIDRKMLVLAACDCAEPALQYGRDGEDRPEKVIQMARDWCAGIVTMHDVRNAAVIAFDCAGRPALAAGYAAAAAGSYYPGDAGIHAANAAVAASYAAFPRDTSADIANRHRLLAISADLVRQRIPLVMIEEKWKCI